VGAGAKAAQGTTDGDKKSVALQTALTSAIADSHNAQVAVVRATEKLNEAKDALAAGPSDDAQKIAAVNQAQKELDDAKKDLQDKQAKLESAQNAATASKAKGTDSATSQANA
jgi:hypothetical protein